VDVDVFSEAQRGLLRLALNRIIPPVATQPGAGDLGLAEAIEALARTSLALRRLFLEGLAELELMAWRQTDHRFADLLDAEQNAVLVAVEQAAPVFFDQLVRRTYAAYYVNPQVLVSLGVVQPAPQPRGFTLPPFDPKRLDVVRSRGPVWRPT
jgi:hypothetical protein